MIIALLTIANQLVNPYASRTLDVLNVPNGRLKIVFRGTNGPVRIQAGYDKQIVLKQLTRADKVVKLSEVKLERSWNGSELRLITKENFKTPGEPSKKYPGAIDYSPPLIETTLIIPRETDLDVETTNSSIRISGVSGKVRVKTFNGDILYGIQSNQLHDISAKTFNGTIRSEVAMVLGRETAVSLESFNGNIQLKKPNDAYYLKGGSVFDGKGFSKQDWYMVDGLFTKVEPTGSVKELDLAGKFIVPPYGDAHCHHIDGAYLARQLNDKYLSEGTLYVQSMGNHSSLRDEADTVVNKSNSIDVAYANAGFTAEYGHPAYLYESLQLNMDNKLTPQERADYVKSQKRVQVGDSYWLADSPALLEESWPKYLASDPDIVKVFLVDTINRPQNLKGMPGTVGLDTNMLPLVVKKGHEAGLKVYAHVDTAYDFLLAMRAGVDGTAHMPGYGMNKEEAERFAIDGKTARLAAKRFIQPTISLATYYSEKDRFLAVQQLQKKNVAALRAAGASFVVGSDNFSKTQIEEALSWNAVGFSNTDIFRSLFETTPQSIFPYRKIGRIVEGYEGSFVVLDANPMTDLSKAFAPLKVYKRGVEVYARVGK